MKQVLISVTNDLVTDQRVIKTATLLVSMGFNVTMIGRKRSDSLPFYINNIKAKRFRLLFNKKFLFYTEYNIRLFFYLLSKRCDLYIANDLDTLLPNFLLSEIKNKPLIYDSHEYFTGVPEIQKRPLVKKIWELIERITFPKLKDVITVNNSIAELYYKKYNIRPEVIRNVPKSQTGFIPKSRKELGWPGDKNIILMQGSGINIERGAEELLLSMKPCYGLKNTILYFIGGGDVINTLKQMIADNHLEESVFVLSKMDHKSLQHYTANADIGVTLDKANSINYTYSLPNKLFDYIMAGIPILASPLPEIKKIIKKYDIGIVTDNHNPKHIAEKINEMLNNDKRYKEWKSNTQKAAQELCWEKESVKLKKILEKYM